MDNMLLLRLHLGVEWLKFPVIKQTVEELDPDLDVSKVNPTQHWNVTIVPLG